MGREHLKRMTVGQVMAYLSDKPLDMPVAIAVNGLPEGRGFPADDAQEVITSIDLTSAPVRQMTQNERHPCFYGVMNPKRTPPPRYPRLEFEGRRKQHVIIIADNQR